MNSQFGNKIRILREEQKMLLRQLAPLLDMDTAQLSKIERGERNAKKETVLKLAEILKVVPDELITLWLADQVLELLHGEPLADKALKSVTKKRKQDNVN